MRITYADGACTRMKTLVSHHNSRNSSPFNAVSPSCSARVVLQLRRRIDQTIP